MSIKSRVKALAHTYAQDIITIRRHLHAHPELSYQEYGTARYVAEQLKDIGLIPQEHVAETGLTALIEGKNPGKRVIALRADMDALPIHEANEVAYKSQNEGIMHACGHDAHTACLLGAARILHEVRKDFEGSIKLIFQPGEEKNPGGASLMIKDGALENPRPHKIYGQHVMPLIPVGKVGFREGMYMASADEIYLTVKGKGGHGAIPEIAIDPVLIGSHIIVAMQQVISRHSSPRSPSVLSFGKFIANGATNIIPEQVEIAGTFRALDEVWRDKALGIIQNLAENLAKSMGGECHVHISKGYPYLENHPETTRMARSAAEEYVGKDNIVDLEVWMGAEDFAYYTHEVDACFYRLGTRNEAKGITSYVHTPTFDIDEDALELGAGLMAWIALRNLGAE